MISATHTHSAPGGYMHDLLFDLSVLGFVRQSFVALMAGIVMVSVARVLKRYTLYYITSSTSLAVGQASL